MAKKAEDVFRNTMSTQARAAAEQRGKELVAEHLTLQQLRKARQLTQAQLAQTLGKDQVAISQIEKRADMLLSTLRAYVEAMGGRLSLVIQFKDQEPVHLRGFGEDQTSGRTTAKAQLNPTADAGSDPGSSACAH